MWIGYSHIQNRQSKPACASKITSVLTAKQSGSSATNILLLLKAILHALVAQIRF